MKALKFEEWKEQNITPETKKELAERKEKLSKRLIPEKIGNIKDADYDFYQNEMARLSEEEQKEVKKKSKEIMDWLGEQTFLIPFMLEKEININHAFYVGERIKEFMKKFDFTFYETVDFFQMYKYKILNSLQNKFG